ARGPPRLLQRRASPARAAIVAMNAARDERRRTDRRLGDRRQADRRRKLHEAEDSWFGALADAGDGPARAEPDPESMLHEVDPEAGSESRFLAREARRIVSGEGTALRRVFRAYVLARAVLGAA